MLGAHHNPFQVGGDPNTPGFSVQNLNLAQGLSLDRLEERRSLTQHFDSVRRHIDSLDTARAATEALLAGAQSFNVMPLHEYRNGEKA